MKLSKCMINALEKFGEYDTPTTLVLIMARNTSSAIL